MAQRYSQDSPKWVEADAFEELEGKKATAEGWGERFEGYPTEREPSDRGSSAILYITVQHSSGNWLRLYKYI